MKRALTGTIYAGYILATALSLIALPTWFRFHNPPYHRYGGFDLPRWQTGLVIYALELAIALIYTRKRHGSRIINLAITAFSLAAIAYMFIAFYAVIRHTPTI